MQRKKISFHSLDRPEDFFWLCLCATIGSGHFFLVPNLVVSSHSVYPLLFYILGCLLVAFPVIYSEILWGRWFQRSMYLSFHSYKAIWAYIGLTGSFAIVLQLPNLLKKTSSLLILTQRIIGLGGQVPSGSLRYLDADTLILGAVMFLVWNLCLFLLMFPTKFLVSAAKIVLSIIFVIWGIVLFCNANFFGFGDIQTLFPFDSSEITLGILVKSVGLSLIGVTAGLGIFQNFAVYSTAPTLRGFETDQKYWRKPGRLFSLSLKIILVHLTMIAFSFFVMLPFSDSLLRSYSQKTGLRLVLFEWLPQIWGQLRWGGAVNILWFMSFTLLGIIGILSLVEFVIYQIEATFKWSRNRILLHFSIGALGFVLLALVPAVPMELEKWVRNFLWPLFTLFFVIWIGRTLPLKTQQRFLGRSLLLDQIASVVFGILKWVLPLILALTLANSLFWG